MPMQRNPTIAAVLGVYLTGTLYIAIFLEASASFYAYSAIIGFIALIRVANSKTAFSTGEILATGVMLSISLSTFSDIHIKFTICIALAWLGFKGNNLYYPKTIATIFLGLSLTLCLYIATTGTASLASEAKRLSPGFDPNTASFLIFLSLLIFSKTQKTPWIPIMAGPIIAVVLLSRSFTLFYVSFILLTILKNTKLIRSIERIPPFLIILSIGILGNSAQIVAYNSFEIDTAMESAGTANRLTTIEGFSTLSRLYISKHATSDWINNPESLIMGNRMQGEEWLDNYGNIIHNSYMQIAIPCGIPFALAYFFLLSRIYKNHFKRDDIPWILPYFCVACISTDFFYVTFLAAHLTLLSTRTRLINRRRIKSFRLFPKTRKATV